MIESVIAALGAWLSAPPGSVMTFVLVFSAPIIGSFLGVVTDRLPHGEDIVVTPSRCITCGTRLSVLDLVPIAGFIALAGRCRACGARIPVVLPILEAGCLLISTWTILALGPQAGIGAILATLVLGYALLALTVIDLEHYILPDVITLPLLIVGLFVIAFSRTEALGWHGLGAAIGYGAVMLVAGLYYGLRGREGIGRGDAKLLAAAGAWAGPLALPSILLIASLAGLTGVVVMRVLGRQVDAQTAIPFGPFIALGLWLTWLYGPLGFGAPAPMHGPFWPGSS